LPDDPDYSFFFKAFEAADDLAPPDSYTPVPAGNTFFELFEGYGVQTLLEAEGPSDDIEEYFEFRFDKVRQEGIKEFIGYLCIVGEPEAREAVFHWSPRIMPFTGLSDFCTLYSSCNGNMPDISYLN